MTLNEFISRIEQPRKTGRGWIARCPSHEDRSPSLCVAEGDDGRILLHCFAGCDGKEVVNAMGLHFSDLFEGTRPRQSQKILRSTRRKTEVIDSAEMAKAGTFREAEAIIDTAKGIDISKWTEKKLDRAMNIVSEAHEIIMQDIGYG